jgi:hypothetical protein
VSFPFDAQDKCYAVPPSRVQDFPVEIDTERLAWRVTTPDFQAHADDGLCGVEELVGAGM